MHIKKEFNNNIETIKTNSEENEKEATPTNCDCNSKENEKEVSPISKWISLYRLKSRQKMQLKPLTFGTFLTFLPFALGFSQVLAHHINPGKTNLFQTNLPVFTSFKPKLNVETLDYIVKPNAWRNFTDVDVHKLLFKTDTFVSSKSAFLFSQPDFVAKRQNKKFTGLSCDFYMIPSGNFLQTNKIEPKNFDELPSYIKGLNQKYVNREPLTLFSPLTNLIHPQLDTLDLSSTNPQKTFTKKAKLLVGEFPSRPSAPIQNHFYSDRLEFSETLTELNSELQNLFSEKALSGCMINYNGESDIYENRLENFTKQYPHIDEDVLIDKILANVEKIKISEELPGFRLMSGYKYPDTTTTDLQWFYTLNKNFGFDRNLFTGFKQNFSTLPFQSKKYSFSIKNLPQFSIQTKKLILQNSQQNKVVYEGPSLVLDSKTGLDWKNRREETLRSWFHSYLSPFNSLIQLRENFFGTYYSPEFSVDGKNVDFSDFKNNSFFRLKYYSSAISEHYLAFGVDSKSVQGLFAPFSSSLHVPSQKLEKTINFNQKEDDLGTKNEINQKFSKFRTGVGNIKKIGIKEKNSKNEEGNPVETFLPLVQLQQPSFKTYKESSQLFEGYSPLFEFGVKGNPDSSFSTNSLDQQDFVMTRLASGHYTKMPSFFSPRSTPFFVDNWEPLTLNSWLVLSQLSFAVLSFNVLKSLAANYGRELLAYLLDLVATLGFLDESLKQEIEILIGQRNKGYKVILESGKKFNDIVGIQKLLPEIYEVVWFLRNSARDFALSKNLPRGILLTGPPGTGKTLLVQAMAGEAKVPVIILSGSSLIEPGESGAVKLQMVFQEARELAPCIVFIDEIDTLSAKRSRIIQNPMGQDEVLESLTHFEKPASSSPLDVIEASQENQNDEHQVHSNQQQLSLLTQCLIELDGIQGRDGVIVIGATNRIEVLDPALLRPGRFDKIIQVGLPNHKKRIEILQFYAKRIKTKKNIPPYQENIPWEYLGERTEGFTAADLATLMNESTLKAISTHSNHTIETIEHGIDRLTTSESEKYTIIKSKSTLNEKQSPDTTKQLTLHETQKQPPLSISSKMLILRLAYYQAGKVVLSHVLETHPNSVVASLWPRRPTMRSIQITTNLQNSVFEFARLHEVTDRLIGCYAGKAAEFLFLQKFAKRGSSQMSTLGSEDLVFAQKLIYCILDKWYFYSKRSLIQKTIPLQTNINSREFREIPEKIDLYQEFIKNIQTPPMRQALETESSSLLLTQKKESGLVKSSSQIYYSVPWWQQEVSNEVELRLKNFANGSRFYLYNSEKNERNPEWLPPDEFYHNSISLKNVKTAFANLRRAGATKKTQTKLPTRSSLTPLNQKVKSRKIYFPWNEITKLTRDYPAHSLGLQSFNKALLILNDNRELLDRLVVKLLYQEILRQPEVDDLVKKYQNKQISKTNEKNVSRAIDPLEKQLQVEIVESSWGPQSRKPLPRWIDFTKFRGETT
jgi:ATP-dependent Zn protease